MNAQAATTAGPGWRSEGTCVTRDPRLMFPEDEHGEQAPAGDFRWPIAASVCTDCPVLAECTTYGDRHPSFTYHGVSAGLTPWQWQKRRRAQHAAGQRARRARA